VSYRPADYLDQTGRQTRWREIVPERMWQALVTYVQDPTSAAAIGHAATQRMVYRHAIPLLRRAADNGIIRFAFELAELLVSRGDVEEALRCYAAPTMPATRKPVAASMARP
jgi:hypothetical protein